MKSPILRYLTVVAMLGMSVIGRADMSGELLAKHPAGEIYEAEFTEADVMPKQKKEVRKAGRLVFKSPNYLRLDYAIPDGDYMLMDEGVFDSFEGGNLQHKPIHNGKSAIAKYRLTLLSAFQGDVATLAAINGLTAICDKIDDKFVATLTDNKPNGKHLELKYDAETGRLLEFMQTEANGNCKIFSFR